MLVATGWFDVGFPGNPDELTSWVCGRSEEIRTTALMSRRIWNLRASIGTIDDDIHRIQRIMLIDSRIG
jgi:hypothetical protein